MLRPLLSGSRTVFTDGWDPALAVELVHRFGVTCTAGTPFHLEGILDLGDTGDKLASLREFLVGAAPVAEQIGAARRKPGSAPSAVSALPNTPLSPVNTRASRSGPA